jgi:hypothetical protein
MRSISNMYAIASATRFPANICQLDRAHGRDGGIDVAAVLDPDESGPTTGPQEKEDKGTRRVVRKIDLRLIPVLAVICE